MPETDMEKSPSALSLPRLPEEEEEKEEEEVEEKVIMEDSSAKSGSDHEDEKYPSPSGTYSWCSSPASSSFSSLFFADRPRACEIEEYASSGYFTRSMTWISRHSHRSSSKKSFFGEEEEEEQKYELSRPMRLAASVRKAAEEAEFFKAECADLAVLGDGMVTSLHSVASLATSHPFLDNRSHLLGASVSCSKSLRRALKLCLSCRRGVITILRRRIATSADFWKVSTLLEACAAEMEWLNSIYSTIVDAMGPNMDLRVPPMACIDPICCWYRSRSNGGGGSVVGFAIDNSVATLVCDEDQNKHIIVADGALSTLLSFFLMEPSLETRLDAVVVLVNIAGCEAGVSAILAEENSVATVVRLLSESSVELQTHLVSLVVAMAVEPAADERFAKEKIVLPLMAILSNSAGHADNMIASPSDTELTLQLEILCAHALYLLCKNYSFCLQIIENNGIQLFAKIVGIHQKDTLGTYCLVTMDEICTVLRVIHKEQCRIDAVKLAVEQLVWAVEEAEVMKKQLKRHAMYNIGSLSRVVPEKEKLISAVAPLVMRLDDQDPKVGAAAAFALLPFAKANELCSRVGDAVVELKGVEVMERLVESSQDSARSDGNLLLTALRNGSVEFKMTWYRYKRFVSP